MTRFILTPLLLSVLAACQAPTLLSQRPVDTSSLQRQSTGLRVAKPPVEVMTSPNFNERPEGAKISAIVLHHTAMAGDARETGRFFANPKAGASAHFTVDRTGYIVESVPEHLRSWHAGRSEFQGVGDVNNYSIGIEICNVGDGSEAYSDAQYETLIRLVSYLVKQYQIPLDRITRHRDVAVPAGRKIDTSNNFSVQRVLNGVKAVMAGTYQSPVQRPPQVLNIGDTREVVVQAGQTTFALLAEMHLDHETRAIEIAHLNPQVRDGFILPGTRVKIPTTYALFATLAR
jgi:N-acetyl-anhydromuramyl-L-alanine amidase AmpD